MAEITIEIKTSVMLNTSGYNKPGKTFVCISGHPLDKINLPDSKGRLSGSKLQIN